MTALLEPGTIDGLVCASSMVILHAARNRLPVPRLARWMLALSLAASLAVNVAQGWSHGLVAQDRTRQVPHGRPADQVRGPEPGGPGGTARRNHEGGPVRESTGPREPAGPVTPGLFVAAAPADGIDAAAVAAYRASLADGKPWSERKLAAAFGKTSRRRARNRMVEARQAPAAV